MTNSKIDQYRSHAAKCISVAQNTPDIQSKLKLLEMARGWLLLADQGLKNSRTSAAYAPPTASVGEPERRVRRQGR
jgi:hypothetical protein